MSVFLKAPLKVVAGLLLLALLIAWVVVLIAVASGSSSHGDKEAFGHLTALVVLVIFTWVIHRLGRGVGRLVTGADNRVSTSKVQVVLWTYIVGAGLLSLIASTWAGLSTGFDAITSSSFEFGPYLVLLGGPFLGAIGARALVASQVESGQSAKPPGEPSASQALTDDSGNADLIDCQYMLFNLIAIAYFLGAFISDPTRGFPEIPTLIYVLTGASALGYVTNKAIPSGAPTLASASPSSAAVGGKITIFGSGLLFPKEPTAVVPPSSVEQFNDIQVMVGGREAKPVQGSLSSTRAGGDRLEVVVPQGLDVGSEYDLVALNFRGTQSNAIKLCVIA